MRLLYFCLIAWLVLFISSCSTVRINYPKPPQKSYNVYLGNFEASQSMKILRDFEIEAWLNHFYPDKKWYVVYEGEPVDVVILGQYQSGYRRFVYHDIYGNLFVNAAQLPSVPYPGREIALEVGKVLGLGRPTHL